MRKYQPSLGFGSLSPDARGDYLLGTPQVH